ncbi:hypothetical protein [Ornithinimicrobium pekingense]|uniref:hypothetical protein n=1 Tax=Ornithinimicrobium pekingense TaxID=384677 RepID=UPI0003B5E709|nr:hypothetical protein [Ornithinimicrobium pekingense]
MRERTSTLTGERVRVYRTVPARVIGWTMVAGAAVLTALTAVDLASGAGGGLAWPVALVVAVAAAAWALFLRPHVELRTDGVVLANIVTDTTVPFAAVEEVTDRWALEVHDVEGRRFSSWAVPVRREWARRTRIDDFAETTRRRGSGGITAQGVADEVQRALQRWRLDGGQLTAVAGEPSRVTQRVSWSSAAVLALAVGLLVLAALG